MIIDMGEFEGQEDDRCIRNKWEENDKPKHVLMGGNCNYIYQNGAKNLILKLEAVIY